jgi:hypothetical protein
MAHRNIQVDDLLMVQMWGDVHDVEYNPEYDSWKCLITGKSLDDDDVSSVITSKEFSINDFIRLHGTPKSIFAKPSWMDAEHQKLDKGDNIKFKIINSNRDIFVTVELFKILSIYITLCL